MHTVRKVSAFLVFYKVNARKIPNTDFFYTVASQFSAIVSHVEK